MKCAVITPVGPETVDMFQSDCEPSVKDAIAHSKGPFSEIIHMEVGCDGPDDRAQARNVGVARAAEIDAEWVFFLEPEDLMTPPAFETLAAVLEEHPDLDAVWGLFCDLADGAPELREAQIQEASSQAEMLAGHPYQSVKLGCFVRTSVARDTPFDGSVIGADDVAFAHAVWATYRCAKKPAIFQVTRLPVTEDERNAFNARKEAAGEVWKSSLREEPVFKTVTYDGRDAQMRITNPDDLIQNAYIFGEFFEFRSLEKLPAFVKADAPVILEVGANIGNHVVWYAQHLNASKIYPVEPNPDAISLLDDNITANNLIDVIDRRGMGYGVGAEPGHFALVRENVDNLGATSLAPSYDGQVEVTTIDALMEDEHVDFMKIDVEGMEMDVLVGAEALISRSKPVIWVEVMQRNTMAFMQKWCRKMGYRIAGSEKALNATDFFVVPR